MAENVAGSEKNVAREPFLAGILSFLFMGLGQAYNGQRRKGYMFFASYIVFTVLYFILLKVFNEPLPVSSREIPRNSPSYIITAIVCFVVWVFNIYDSCRSSKRINEGNEIADSTPGRSSFVFIRTIFLWFVAIAGSFIALVFILAFLSHSMPRR